MRSAMLCLLLVPVGSTVFADDGTQPTTNEAGVASSDADPPEDEAEQQRRQNAVTVGVLILVGVAAIGLLLMAAALIWGAKVRRMVRPTDAEPTRQDQLWYLRKAKPPVGDSEPATDETPPETSSSQPPIRDSDDTRS